MSSTRKDTAMLNAIIKKARKSHGFALLSVSNPKIEKGLAEGVWTFALHLAPARLSGFETCPKRTTGCSLACLNTAGRGGLMVGHKGALTPAEIEAGTVNAVQAARIRKTRRFFMERPAFAQDLVADVVTACRRAANKGLKVAFRLNATSDIRWENVPVTRDGIQYRNIMLAFPHVQFYDYTKIANRRHLPPNYHLTFSLADGNGAEAVEAYYGGMNVAVVFRSKDTVARYKVSGFNMGYTVAPVHGGDDTDLRFLDPKRHVIALYAKGAARKDSSGFVWD